MPIKPKRTNWKAKFLEEQAECDLLQAEVRDIRQQLKDANARVWNPADGIWTVSNNGCSRRKVAELSDEPIAPIIGNLAVYADDVASAMSMLCEETKRRTMTVVDNSTHHGEIRWVTPSFFDLAIHALLTVTIAHFVRYPPTATPEKASMPKKKGKKRPPC